MVKLCSLKGVIEKKKINFNLTISDLEIIICAADLSCVYKMSNSCSKLCCRLHNLST